MPRMAYEDGKWGGFTVAGLRAEVFRHKVLSQLNGELDSNGVHSKLEGKYYRSIDMVIPFNCVFVDKTTGYGKDGELKKLESLKF